MSLLTNKQIILYLQEHIKDLDIQDGISILTTIKNIEDDTGKIFKENKIGTYIYLHHLHDDTLIELYNSISSKIQRIHDS